MVMLPWGEELEMLIWLGSSRSTKKKTEVAVPYVSILEDLGSPGAREEAVETRRVCPGGIWGMAHLYFIVRYLGRFLGRFMRDLSRIYEYRYKHDIISTE